MLWTGLERSFVLTFSVSSRAYPPSLGMIWLTSHESPMSHPGAQFLLLHALRPTLLTRMTTIFVWTMRKATLADPTDRLQTRSRVDRWGPVLLRKS